VEVASGLSAGDKVVVNGNLLIDGQAEMNRAFAEPASTNTPAAKLPALTDAQRKGVKDFLTLADAVTASLAADKLNEFNAQAAKSHAAMPVLMDAFVNADKAWHPLLKSIEEAGHLEKADDLKVARKTFLPFSSAAVALVQTLRRSEKEFASLKVFRCPMTKTVFPGAPAAAEWMQLKPAISNPYMGVRMPDCGTEVKP
jgi:Cu(I)/Ag(I) efflux system membrane fusion protein